MQQSKATTRRSLAQKKEPGCLRAKGPQDVLHTLRARLDQPELGRRRVKNSQRVRAIQEICERPGEVIT